jgi:hypothetical protein
VSAYPRPHPGGGWYCEHGTLGGPPCMRRATRVLASCANDPGRYPGAVTCDGHEVVRASTAEYVALPSPADEGAKPALSVDDGASRSGEGTDG